MARKTILAIGFCAVFFIQPASFALDADKARPEYKNVIEPSFQTPLEKQPTDQEGAARTYRIGAEGAITAVTDNNKTLPMATSPQNTAAVTTDITFKYKEGKPVEIDYKNEDSNIPAVSIERVTPKVEIKVEVEKITPKEESTALKEGTITITEEMKKVKETEETNALVSPAAKDRLKLGEEEKPETTFVEGGIGVKEIAPGEKKDLIEKETGKKLRESKIQQKQYVKRVLGYAVSEEDVPWYIVQDMLYHEKELKRDPEGEESFSVPVDTIIRGEVQSVDKAQSKAIGLKSSEGVLYTFVGEAEEMLRGKEGSQAKITGRSVPDLNYKGKKIKVVEIIGIEETD